MSFDASLRVSIIFIGVVYVSGDVHVTGTALKWQQPMAVLRSIHSGIDDPVTDGSSFTELHEALMRWRYGRHNPINSHDRSAEKPR